MILRQKGVPPKLANGLLQKLAGIVDNIRNTVTTLFVERSLGWVQLERAPAAFF